MKLSTLFIIPFLVISMAANAHGPTPKKADKSIIINASINKVWAVIKNFDDISNWHPDVISSVGDGKNESGSERRITMESGVLEEGLDYFSDADHEYNYRLKTENTDVFPVSSYTTGIQLIAEDDNNTKVKWKSRYYRGDTGNTPPKRLNDEAAVKAMNSFIENGLQGLKETLEK
ncbi:MxaD protein [Methyloprofundus sedimenti]|uniref:MxaD protein n=1 Tax=Methyloprofundus sedimenti TaxID=1420851 RepID=A0A1V8M5H0_9GAMM|nr:SRPBCC family protein [Methyloprofundus sedimenti]OQK16804.1 MxaD protein [Methyloprofundus sedimenti]